jgi:hypothetical protein
MAEVLRPARREHTNNDERSMLQSFLDDYRDIVVRKVAKLSDTDARRRLVPSPTTVGGLIKHLRWAEYGWFEQLLQQQCDDNRRAHDRSWELGIRIPCRRVAADADRRISSPVRTIPAYRRTVSTRPRRAASPLRHGFAALDLRAHDRGNCPPYRTTGHLARTTRRRNGIRLIGERRCANRRRYPAIRV